METHGEQKSAVDLGPAEVVVNGTRYVREATLFAAMERIEELEALVTSYKPLPTDDEGKCNARRTHPLSTDFSIACTSEAGHDGNHTWSDVTWDDDSPYALPQEAR